MVRYRPKADTPVFYDMSGKRWRTAKIVALVLACCLAVFLTWAIPTTLADRRVVSFQNPRIDNQTSVPIRPVPTDTNAFATQLSKTNIPVIGTGSLVRVVESVSRGTSHLAVDPFTGKAVSVLSSEDVLYLNGDRYAIQRYGDSVGKRIALTFDDGPDPTYTPRILDVLSKESAQATFFVTGDNVVKYSDVAQRIVREGHLLANHTFSHVDFDFVNSFEAGLQINQAERVIAAATGQATSYFRLPYGGNTDQSLRNSLTGLLAAQKLGYTVTSYDFDSNDWKFNQNLQPSYPQFDGKDKIILVHDGGGDRSHTISYVSQMIRMAREHGYRFVNLNSLYPQTSPLAGPTDTAPGDTLAYAAAWSVLVLPHDIITGLFLFSFISILFMTVLNIVLALIHRRRTVYKRISSKYRPFVTIAVPAYNEGPVLTKTVRSLMRSRYKNTEIIIVDDGSTDDTWQIARKLADRYGRVTALHQKNGGKSSALNNAIRHAKGSIIIGVDADTVFPPSTVTKLVRHFKDPRVGAVAGVVKVGNVKGILTLWQALEYSLSISIERNAHALLGSIMIVPGACGAWRKAAIVKAGGLSHSTLAEDCDLTLKIQSLGKYRILQDNEAVSFTEAPQKLKSLIKQRFRWTFGSIQALYKHRRMILNERYGYLGMFTMPFSVISIMVPLLFWPILTAIAYQNIIQGNYFVILLFFAATLTLQFIVAFIGLLFAKAPLSYLIAVPFARFIYGPIRIYVLYRTLLVALKGSSVGWNKFARTGNVQYGTLRHRTRRSRQFIPG